MKKEAIKPLGENVLIKPIEEDIKTKSGLVLPDSAKEDRPQEGKVVAVGEDKKIRVKRGQRVIFAKYSGTEIKRDKEKFFIMKNEDILATIE